MKKNILFLLLLILFGLQANAQRRNKNQRDNKSNSKQYNNGYDNRRRAPSLSMGMQLIDPRGQLGSLYNKNPIGISGLFTVNWGLSPIEFGFGAAWHQMGKSSEKVTIVDGQNSNGNNIFVDGKLAVKSNLYTYQVVGRFKPMAGPIQPYADLIGGFRTFSTKTVIKQIVDGSFEEISNERNKRDFSLIHGWAAGLKIRLNDYLMAEGRVEFLKGSEVEFIDPQSIEIDYFGNVQYQELISKSDMRIFHLGITVEF